MTISLVLVEEPDSCWKKDVKVQGALNLPAQKQHLEKISKLAGEFSEWKPEKIYSSSLDPAFSCAEDLSAEMGLKHLTTDLLLPLDMGCWTALDWLEVKDRYARQYRRWKADPGQYLPPSGESMCAVEERLDSLMTEVRDKAENVLIVASNEVLAGFCNKVLPKFGATISFGDDKEDENLPVWQLFDHENGWMVWDLLVDDEG
ncbi:MAG: histidine phosphatase family protein [Planctomycetota bacterium]|jgi:broad specificity phosphatase PhoE